MKADCLQLDVFSFPFGDFKASLMLSWFLGCLTVAYMFLFSGPSH